MAGKPKPGINYAGWSVDIFDNDTKIDKLLDAHGWIGFSVYFFLCMKAFGSDGYYYKWSFDNCASTAKKMGGGIRSETVKEAVEYCLKIGLFDRGLFDRFGLLTSRGIQRSYLTALKKRRSKNICKELWLLKNEECEGLVFVTISGDSSDAKGHLQAANGETQGTNAPVVKESINNILCAESPHDNPPKELLKEAPSEEGDPPDGEDPSGKEDPPDGEGPSGKEAPSDWEAQLLHDFEIIYAIYPKKRGRTAAFANYKQWVSRNGKTVSGKRYRLTNKQIYLAVKRYIRQKEADGQDDLQFWKNFDTLMGRSLLDYVDFGKEGK